MATKNPPPSPQILRSFAKTPEQIKEAAELRQFLYLLWESLGGGDDLVADSTADVADAVVGAAQLMAEVIRLSQRVDDIDIPIIPSLDPLDKRIDDIEQLIPIDVSQRVAALERRVEELSNESMFINLTDIYQRISNLEAQL